MKPMIVTSIFLLAALAENAGAVCGSPAVRVQGNGANSLGNLLQNRTVCAAAGSESWHEYHQSNGNLFDIKKGSSDPVDPTEQVGTWAINGQGNGTNRTETVVYSYSSGGTYEYAVWRQTNGSYDFCGATTVSGATLSIPSSTVPANSPC